MKDVEKNADWNSFSSDEKKMEDDARKAYAERKKAERAARGRGNRGYRGTFPRGRGGSSSQYPPLRGGSGANQNHASSTEDLVEKWYQTYPLSQQFPTTSFRTNAKRRVNELMPEVEITWVLTNRTACFMFKGARRNEAKKLFQQVLNSSLGK